MNWDRQRELLPHYAAVFLLIGVYMAAVRAAFGDVVPAVDILGVVVVVLGYPTVARLVGFAPGAWEEG